MSLAEAWDIFDNSAMEPVLVVKLNENGLQVLDKELYKGLIKPEREL